MLHLLSTHESLAQAAVAFLAVVLLLTVLRVGTSYRARHSSWRWSTARGHIPRHSTVARRARHAAVPPQQSAVIGRTPDGDLQLVDDEHTHELIGATS